MLCGSQTFSEVSEGNGKGFESPWSEQHADSSNFSQLMSIFHKNSSHNCVFIHLKSSFHHYPSNSLLCIARLSIIYSFFRVCRLIKWNEPLNIFRVFSFIFLLERNLSNRMSLNLTSESKARFKFTSIAQNLPSQIHKQTSETFF
jgi:hypothetical protein